VLSRLDAIEMIVAFCLFVLNVLVSWAVMREELYKRYRYIGQEMAYLSVGLIVFHIHWKGIDLGVTTAALLVHLLLWFFIAAISARILEDKSTYKNPLVAITTLVGGVLVYAALTGWVATALGSLIPAVPR
jgi:DMSO/TMAO reductase YedYZ heme-binding membrane subunit